MKDVCCEKCRYWDNSVSSALNPDDSGACRINPPVADDRTSVAVWPFTDASDWCGRFFAPEGTS